MVYFNINALNYLKIMQAWSHFRKYEHDFIKHAKLTLKQLLKKVLNATRDTSKLTLKEREDFWILKLETFTLKCLNQVLNTVLVSVVSIIRSAFIILKCALQIPDSHFEKKILKMSI